MCGTPKLNETSKLRELERETGLAGLLVKIWPNSNNRTRRPKLHLQALKVNPHDYQPMETHPERGQADHEL